MKGRKLSYYKAKTPLELITFVNGLDNELVYTAYDGVHHIGFYYMIKDEIIKEQSKTNLINDLNVKKQKKRAKIKSFLLRAMCVILYIAICVSFMIVLDNTTELSKQYSWFIGWVMGVIYASLFMK